MSRSRTLAAYGLTLLALVVVFGLFIGFRDNGALVGALEAAGTVAAAGFAAVAALGSMRAAAESGATARRARESQARSVRPRVYPTITRADGHTFGVVRCGTGQPAVDVFAVWSRPDHGPVTSRAARLELVRADIPPDVVTESTVDLEAPESADPREAVSLVWIEYWDGGRIGQWRDTWEVAPDSGTLVLTDSDLVD